MIAGYKFRFIIYFGERYRGHLVAGKVYHNAEFSVRNNLQKRNAGVVSAWLVKPVWFHAEGKKALTFARLFRRVHSFFP